MAQFLDREGDPIEGTTVNDDGTVTLTLEKPVQVFSETRSELIFSKPLTGALIRTDSIKGATKQAMALIAASANVPTPAVEAFDFADFTAASRIMGGFSRKSRTSEV